MSSAASSSRPSFTSESSISTRCRQGALAGLFATVLATGLIWTDGEDGIAVAVAAIPPHIASDVVIVSLPPVAAPEMAIVAILPPDDIADGDMPALAETAMPPAVDATPAALSPKDDLLYLLKAGVTGAVAIGREKTRAALPKFSAAYRSLRQLVALTDIPRIQQDAALAQTTIVGIASTYNPYRDGLAEGGVQTASGEFYDPAAWTAAIQTGLRGQFGGVRYGRLYLQAYALVESGDKQVVVKINDVGPLRPGRVIDLNERAMRYFDPFLRRGLLSDVKVTLLPGEDWTPGPVVGAQLISYASAQ